MTALVEDKVCAYCGDWYECNDHVIPWTWDHARERKWINKKGTVPCCKLCNGFKSDLHFNSMPEIGTYLIGRYQRKFWKLLRSPSWSPKEMLELDYTLQSHILHRQDLKRLINAKIENLISLEQNFKSKSLREFDDGCRLFLSEYLK